MAHFAKLDDNNYVLEIHLISNDALDSENEEASGIVFLTEWSNGYEKWKQTSYNNNFRKQYAGIGYYYDSENDVFIAPQPFPSWSLNDNFDWQPPKPRPDGDFWFWDEEIRDWVNAETM